MYDSPAKKHEAYIIENLTSLREVPTSGFSAYCFPSKTERIDMIPARILIEVSEV